MSDSSISKLVYDKSWSSYEIDELAYQVFQLMQQNPVISQSKLSFELGASTTAVKRRIDQLKISGFFRKDREIIVPFTGKRLQTEVEGVYDPHILGLVKFHILLSRIKNKRNFEKIDYILSIHPYSQYSSGSFTYGADMYCQFDIPVNEKRKLSDLMKKLQKMDLFEQYTIFKPNLTSSNNADFNSWDTNKRIWWTETGNKDQVKLTTQLDDHLHDASQLSEKIRMSTPINKTLINKLDELDMKLIRELTINSKVSTIELAKIYDVDQSTISRRLGVLKDNVVSRNLLYFDSTAFNLEYPTIFTGNFRPNSEFNENTFHSIVNDTFLPFSSILSTNHSKFSWMVNLPTRKIIEYAKFLWQNTRKFKMLNLDLSTSRKYYFLHLNYLEEEGWNTSNEYFIDQPLELLNSYKPSTSQTEYSTNNNI